MLKDVFSEGSRVEALTAAPVPANKPANAAPCEHGFCRFRHFNVSRQIYNEMRNTVRHSLRLVDRESRCPV